MLIFSLIILFSFICLPLAIFLIVVNVLATMIWMIRAVLSVLLFFLKPFWMFR
ncbi:MAG: hypothetical protein AAF431_11435 [Pseudomonadota bacterium]